MLAPGVGCGALIVENGRVLLVKRIKAPEAGHWNLPGGRVDLFEALETAVIRETTEELGVTIALDGLACLIEMVNIDGQHWVSPVYRAHIVRGTPQNREPGKASAIGWFSLDDLPQPLGLAARQAMLAR